MFKRLAAHTIVTAKYMRLWQQFELIADRVCKAADRSDLYRDIIQTSEDLVAVVSDVGQRQHEIAPLLVKLRLAAYEACLEGELSEAYEPLVQTNLQQVQAALDIARMRSQNQRVGRSVQPCLPRLHRFDMGGTGRQSGA